MYIIKNNYFRFVILILVLLLVPFTTATAFDFKFQGLVDGYTNKWNFGNSTHCGVDRTAGLNSDILCTNFGEKIESIHSFSNINPCSMANCGNYTICGYDIVDEGDDPDDPNDDINRFAAMNYVLVKHLLSDGSYLWSRYLHMSPQTEQNNEDILENYEYISKGQRIGKEGRSGKTCSDRTADDAGVHLHYEVDTSIGQNLGALPNCNSGTTIAINPSPYWGPYDLNDGSSSKNKRASILLPLISRTVAPPTTDNYDVYGIANTDLHGALNINSTNINTTAPNLTSARVAVYNTRNRTNRDNASTNLFHSNNPSGVITGDNNYPVGDYLFVPAVTDTTGERTGYPVKFSFLASENDRIVDNDQRDDDNSSSYETTGEDGLSVPGYFLTATLHEGGSNHTAEWHPNVTGEYNVFVHIPEHGATATGVVYSMGDENFDSIDHLGNGGTWVQLTRGNRSETEFDADDYIELTLENVDDGQMVAFDAIKFEYVSGSPAEHPDLQVKTSIVDNKINLEPNKTFKISATVSNEGDGPSGKTTIHYYRSDDATITTKDTHLGSTDVPSIPAEEISAEYIYDSTAPEAPDEYWIGACVDAVDGESDTENNCSLGVKIDVSAEELPDLALVSHNLDTRRILNEEGEDYTFTCMFKNRGADIAQGTNISMSFIIDDKSYPATPLEGGFSSGETRSFDHKYSIPNSSPPDSISVSCKIDSDELIEESDEGNNNSDIEKIVVIADAGNFSKPKKYPVPTSQYDIKSGDRVFAQCDIALYDCETLEEKEPIMFDTNKPPWGNIVEKLENLKGDNKKWLKILWEGQEEAYCSLRSACTEGDLGNVRNACYFKDYKGKKAEVIYDFVNCRTYDDNNQVEKFKIKKESTGFIDDSNKDSPYEITWYSCSTTPDDGRPCPSSCFAVKKDIDGTPLLSLTDYDRLPYQQSIYELCRIGIVSGYSNGIKGTFGPHNSFSRAEVSKVMINLLPILKEENVEGLPEFPENDSEGNSINYEDIAIKQYKDKYCEDNNKPCWYYSYIGKATKAEIVKGYDDGEFKPKNNISYSELTKMVVNSILFNSEKSPSGVTRGDWVLSEMLESDNQGKRCNFITLEGKERLAWDCYNKDFQDNDDIWSSNKYWYCAYIYQGVGITKPLYDFSNNVFVDITEEKIKKLTSRAEAMKSFYSAYLFRKKNKQYTLLKCEDKNGDL